MFFILIQLGYSFPVKSLLIIFLSYVSSLRNSKKLVFVHCLETIVQTIFSLHYGCLIYLYNNYGKDVTSKLYLHVQPIQMATFCCANLLPSGMRQIFIKMDKVIPFLGYAHSRCPSECFQSASVKDSKYHQITPVFRNNSKRKLICEQNISLIAMCKTKNKTILGISDVLFH